MNMPEGQQREKFVIFSWNCAYLLQVLREADLWFGLQNTLGHRMVRIHKYFIPERVMVKNVTLRNMNVNRGESIFFFF